MSTIVGLDASLTGTGIAVLDQQNYKILYLNTFTNDLKGTTRLAYLKTEILSVIYDFGCSPNPIFIEGYGFSFRGNDYQLAGLGEVLRLAFNECLQRKYIEVPPTTLKMFVTGRGNAPKNIMLEQVFRRYNIGSEVLKDDNQVDAYSLARFGISYLAWLDKKLKGKDFEVKAFKKITDPPEFDPKKAYIL